MAKKKSKDEIAQIYESCFDKYTTTQNIELCKYIASCLNTEIDDNHDWGVCGNRPCIYIENREIPILRIRLRQGFISLNIHEDVITDTYKNKYRDLETRVSDRYRYALNKINSLDNPKLHELLTDIRKKLGIQLLDNNCFPECEEDEKELVEGSKKQIIVNSYERNLEARKKCLEYYGSLECQICGFESAKVYGDEFFGLIHVHHKVPICERNGEYKLDPKTDLIPVCPNCHMLIHSTNGKRYSIDQIKEMVKRRNNN